MFTTEIENGACHCSVESRGSCFYHNPYPPPSINVGGSGKASDNITWINNALGNRGVTFSPKSDKVCQHFFSMIVDHLIIIKHVDLKKKWTYIIRDSYSLGVV